MVVQAQFLIWELMMPAEAPANLCCVHWLYTVQSSLYAPGILSLYTLLAAVCHAVWLCVHCTGCIVYRVYCLGCIRCVQRECIVYSTNFTVRSTGYSLCHSVGPHAAL